MSFQNVFIQSLFYLFYSFTQKMTGLMFSLRDGGILQLHCPTNEKIRKAKSEIIVRLFGKGKLYAYVYQMLEDITGCMISLNT